MIYFLWAVLSILFLVGVVKFIQMVREWRWNRRLQAFQDSHHLTNEKPIPSNIAKIWSTGGVSVALIATLAISFATTFPSTATPYQGVFAVGSELRLNTLLDTGQNNLWNRMFGMNASLSSSSAMESALPGSQTDSSVEGRDYIDTNTQVEGVMESDIVKTNGDYIFYAPRYQNKVRVMQVNDDRSVTMLPTLELDTLYVDALYLTDSKLIVIGYHHSASPLDRCGGYDVCDAMVWYTQSGSLNVFDIATMELEYSLETDSAFFQHRLINDTLFLLANKDLYNDGDYRPSFAISYEDKDIVTHTGYRDIYYFDNTPIYQMTVFSALKLSDYSLNSKAYLGNVTTLYVSQDAIYTADNIYQSIDGVYQSKLHIVKYDIDSEAATIEFAAQTYIRGFVLNQFCMDEYNDYFRIVTAETRWSSNTVVYTNRLYILEQEGETLSEVSVVEEGIGKLNETVKSVRFNQNEVYIVTFEQTDPLYTIDLTNPESPTFINSIEETGYSTYLHVWDEDHIIGIGYAATESGTINGLKISIYASTGSSEPLETYLFSKDGEYHYEYSEALYDHRAILVSPSHQILGFALSSYTSSYNTETLYYDYYYQSEYVLFHINPEAANKIQSITSIEHSSEHSISIDRGIYINSVVYTLSASEMVSFDLTSLQELERIPLE